MTFYLGGLVGSRRLPADDGDDKRRQDSIIFLKHIESRGSKYNKKYNKYDFFIFIEHQKANAIVFDLQVSPMDNILLPPILS